MMDQAKEMVDQGVLAAGYEYIIVDDCWLDHKRDPITGKLRPNPKSFPSGMKALGEYVSYIFIHLLLQAYMIYKFIFSDCNLLLLLDLFSNLGSWTWAEIWHIRRLWQFHLWRLSRRFGKRRVGCKHIG